ncbi:uncharacterized protein LOC108035588 isoform X4 [Drosophila biarmipes]|uniref:uncharacterized protein LOC108035588 isoform X4 n=1 Tax=Drosophila biarmipes TaxID=125945 RepID=UPI001CDADAC8|nr:uncharacterized protein LOC108035588 isoform X4 [Drosophila biarmipes]
MDHLDLAGYHDNSSPNCNRLGAFDQKDGVYLSSSQRMLEPILEETSEDEESSQGSRCGYQKHRSTLWSSMDSEAASVIRINVIKDLYAMPKRDIASPDPIHSPEENVQLRGLLNPESHISIESILVTETCVRSTSESQGQRSDSRIRRGYTFEDFYFENDSYHSLSRSSSLVQFESLERQFMLKEQHHSMNSLGNSSPSLTYEIGASSRTIDSNPESNKGSASSLSLIKRFESSDCSYLHQTYYELNKLKFETQQSRDFLSNDLHKKEQKPNSETSSSSSSSSNRSSPSCSSCMASVGARTTESVTGVQDITAARRIPPNMTDKISEDSGYCERRTHHKKSKSIPKNFDKFFKDETLLKLKEAPPHSRNFNGEYDFYQPKIEQAMNTVTHTVKHTTICSSSTSINSSPEGAGYQSDSAWSLSSTSSSTMFTWLHNSLPDIRESQGLLAVGIIKRESKNAASIKNSISRSPSSIDGCDGKRQLEQISRSSSFKDPARSKVDYKDKRPARERLNHNYKKRQAEDMSDRNSVDEPYCEQPDQLICRENFLLDEISKIYDKNVCILTDKRALDYRFSSPGYCDSNTSDIMLKVHHVQLNPPPLQKRSAQNLSFNKNVTKFNEDQTNLRSTYAQSLDQCHFDMQWEAKAGRYQIKMQKSDAKKNSLVSSTPNLSAFDSRQEAEVEIYVSNTHTSMQHLSQKPTQSNPLSILLSVGSRHSLEKEVSFCPVVSKYSWKKQFAEESTKDHSSEDKLGPSSYEQFIVDNADASVVHNSKENKNVAPFFEHEKTQLLRKQAVPQGTFSSAHATNYYSSFKKCISSENETNNNSPDCLDQKPESFTAPKLEFVLSNPVSLERGVVANLSVCEEHPNTSTYTEKARLLSLPFLSKPPTNRAYNILYASQHMLESYETENRQIQNMPLASAPTAARADEKHSGAKDFLSRFTNGLVFSLRRKKKGQRDHKADPKKPLVNKTTSKKDPCTSTDKGGLEFAHVPFLRPPRIPIDANQLDDSRIACEKKTTKELSRQQPEQLVQTSTFQKVTAKPPLPKLPPRCGILANAIYSTDDYMTDEREQHKHFADQLTEGIKVSSMKDIESTSLTNLTRLRTMKPTLVTDVTVSVSPVEAVGKMGLIETNLDTHETAISGRTRSLMDIHFHAHPHKQQNVTRAYDMDIMGGQAMKSSTGSCVVEVPSFRRPHKSMDFLLNKDNHKNVSPIENELQKSHDSSPADLSEQQLRVQASLQRLNIPDWFRDYNKETRKLPFEGNDSTNSNSGGLQSVNFTRKCTQEPGRWLGLNSKTTSLSSLGSDRSPLLMIPSAHSHHDGHNTFLCRPTASHGPASGQAGLSALRWSTLHLSSTHTSPCVSQRGSFARGSYINSSFMTVASRSGLRNSYRQPYFGWRSTEKLTHWTPHERLANSLIAHRTTQYPTCASNEKRIVQSETPEIQSSIKEVTSSIVRYVNDQHNIQQSLSPNSRKYWLESSFVSSQPLDSPQTPVVDNSPPELARQQQQIDASLSSIVVTEQPSLRMNAHIGGGEPIPNKAPERLLSSASLEDVLTSLLGLPTTSFSSQNTNLYSYNIPNVSSLKTGRHFQVYVFIQHK